MRLSKAVVVARKEWREVLGNRLLLASMASLPAILTAVPLGLVAFAGSVANEANAQQLRTLLKDLPPGTTAAQLVIEHVVLKQWLGLFLMLPVFIPVVISANAVVGEKEKRTIEPLLAAPVSTAELLLGKTVAAVLPGLLITWAAFGVFAIGVNVLAWPHFGRLLLPNPAWLAAVLLAAPPLAFLGNVLSVLVSSRVNDARLAQQLAGTAVLPLVLLVVVQVARGAGFGAMFFVWAALVVSIVDVALYSAAVKAFDREKILTSMR